MDTAAAATAAAAAAAAANTSAAIFGLDASGQQCCTVAL